MAVVNCETKTIRVAMAGVESAKAPYSLTTLLGSCVGIALWSPKKQFGALAHVMLADSNGNDTQPGRFVDTAIPAMLKMMIREAVAPSDIVAKICGGSKMFKTANASSDVGERNLIRTRELLKAKNIPILKEHVGGGSGRVISFDVETGAIEVRIGTKVDSII